MQGPWQEGTKEQGYQLKLSPAALYRVAIGDVDAYCRRTFDGLAFAALRAGDQDHVLKGLEKGDIRLANSSAAEFFPMLWQNTKEGFLADPMLPVHEIPAPPSPLEGENAAPVQPTSALSFMPAPLRQRDMWGATLWDQLACRIAFRSMDYRGPYTAPSTRRTLVYPGNLGVFNWGGVAVDPARQIMIASPVRLAFTFKLIPRHSPNR